ncbi:copper resistance system multicopper oxidase [Planctomycetales bacterium ZRK34]|nr:copper resistance system multicopper oxidase [Planctomycetales bacterium ZRK34]
MSITRRTVLTSTAAAALAGSPWLDHRWQARAAAETLPEAGRQSQLDATAEGGIDLVLEKQDIQVDGKVGRAITINGSIPGPVIRMQQGRDVLIRVHNKMSESTSIHWHGILLPFTMDGVPGISFRGIAPGETFTYRYPVRQSGTYWYHSHSGLQEQLGHYGMLIIDPAEADPVQYDVEYPVVLSDWTFENPHHVLENLKKIEGYYNFQRPTLANLDEQMRATGKSLTQVIQKRLAWQWMRMDPTDLADVTGVTYTYLMNGRSADQNPTFTAKPGQRVRLRLLNASAQTYYDVRLAGLPMTVVNADGQNIKPVETDELRIAVAETYDVVVTLPDDGAYTIMAETMDRSGYARGTLATRSGASAPIPPRRRRPMLSMQDMGMMRDGMKHMAAAQSSSHKPAASDERPNTARAPLPTRGLPDRIKHGPETHGPASITMARTAYRQLDDPGVGLGNDGWRVLTYGQLKILNTPDDRCPPTREFDLHLTGNMHKFIWGFDGKKWSDSKMIRFVYGERLRIHMINDTMMSHPIHLHGMWMDLYTGGPYSDNPRKHTVNVQPAEWLTVDITADAPGQWAFHCHLLYHMERGMFRTVAVVRSLEGEPIDVGA